MVTGSRSTPDRDTYLFLADPEHADRAIDGTMQAAEQLAAFPRMGRSLSDVSEAEARELIVSPYRIVYSVTDDSIEIATVLHSAMNIPTPLRELFGEM